MAEKSKKSRKNKAAIPVGIIAVILAVIGLVSVIRFAGDKIKEITDNTADKAKYEELLEPVVMFDPDPFDDLTQADVSQLLNCAVWSLLMSEEGTEQYPYSEGETFGIVVPQEDIEKHFVSLFGTEIDIASMHSAIDMSAYEIAYDSALKSYILPITGIESAYTPKVYEIEEKGSSVILLVGYISNLSWAQIDSEQYVAPEPDKYMTITLRERSGGMYVSSIQAVDTQEIIGTVPATRAPEITTAPVTVTEPVTEPLTQIVEVTDSDGDTVLNDDGKAVTEIITVTVAQETAAGSTSAEDSSANEAENAED